MTHITHARRVILIGLTLAATVALASCSSAGSDAAGVSNGGAPNAMVGAAPDGAPADVKAATSELKPQIIRNASLYLTAADVAAATASIKSLFTSDHGTITSEDTQVSDGARRSTITGQVPAASLDSFLAAAASAGTETGLSTSAEDVTAQTVDLDARIASLTSTIARLKALMDGAATVSDLLAAEGQLATRQADLDSLTSQRAYLAQQVAMSSVTVSISEPDSTNLALPILAGGLVVLILMGVTGVVVGLLVSHRYRTRQRSSSPTA